MKDIKDLYTGAERLIHQLIRQESTAQGHYLTGTLENSLEAKVTRRDGADVLEGFAISYAEYVDQGVPAEKASMRQFPFLVRYFQQRGLSEEEAKPAAAATIRMWMKEGMSTEASKKHSETGQRQNMVRDAFTRGDEQIDDYMNSGFDHLVEEEFQKEKSETI